MQACLSCSDILDMGQPQIAEMERIGKAYASAQEPGATAAFARQVRRVEGVVVQTYAAAAAVARKADDLQEVAEVWERMGRFCQTALQALAALKQKYPSCGTTELYDLVLDFKLAADKRYKGALEEAACLKMDFPAGLLPELS